MEKVITTFKTNMEVYKKTIDLGGGRDNAIHYFVALNAPPARSLSHCYGDVDWYIELVDFIKADGNLDVCPDLLTDIMNISSTGNEEDNGGWVFAYPTEHKIVTLGVIDYEILRQMTPKTEYNLRANLIQDITQIGVKIGPMSPCQCPSCIAGMAGMVTRMCSDFYLGLLPKKEQ